MPKLSYNILAFAIAESDYDSYKECWNLITTYTSNKHNVPYDIMDKFLRLIKDVERVETDILDQKLSDVVNKTVGRFSVCDKGSYNFTGLKEIKTDDEHYFIPYSLHSMFYMCMWNYQLVQSARDMQTKRDVVRFFYKEILEYSTPLFSEADVKRRTHFRITVMAAYLSSLVGFVSFDKDEFPNDDLYQYGKHMVKDLKTKAAQ
jgi:hypothetical protein